MIPVIILDGISGSGKTTLRRELYNLSNSDSLVIDRFSPSNWVYSNLKGVDNTEEIKCFERIFEITFHPHVFICYCNIELANKRIRNRDNEKRLQFSINDELLMFHKYSQEVTGYKSLYLLDTDNELSKIVGQILRMIK